MTSQKSKALNNKIKRSPSTKIICLASADMFVEDLGLCLLKVAQLIVQALDLIASSFKDFLSHLHSEFMAAKSSSRPQILV